MTALAAPELRRHDAGFAGYRGLDIVAGEGSYVFDSAGRAYLDATSMYGTASIGHAHPELAEALADQAQRLVACFGSWGNDRRHELYGVLQRLLDPLDRFFLCNSGTEAVEAALKLARLATGRAGVVTLARSFHGRTFGALTATSRNSHRVDFEPLLPGFTSVRPDDLEAAREALDPERVGLFLCEVVQGEGGVHPLDDGYLRAVRALCRERGILFAVDEVQTGIGRTGAWFAYRRADLDPDLVCLAKGLGGGVPIGAVAFRGALCDVPAGVHGSTFGGNPLACAAAAVTCGVLERDGVVEGVAEAGGRMLSQLRERVGDRVRDVRGRGFLVGIELAGAAQPVLRRLQERGVLALSAGRRVVRLLPPLTTPPEVLDDLVEAVAEEVVR